MASWNSDVAARALLADSYSCGVHAAAMAAHTPPPRAPHSCRATICQLRLLRLRAPRPRGCSGCGLLCGRTLRPLLRPVGAGGARLGGGAERRDFAAVHAQRAARVSSAYAPLPPPRCQTHTPFHHHKSSRLHRTRWPARAHGRAGANQIWLFVPSPRMDGEPASRGRAQQLSIQARAVHDPPHSARGAACGWRVARNVTHARAAPHGAQTRSRRRLRNSSACRAASPLPRLASAPRHRVRRRDAGLRAATTARTTTRGALGEGNRVRVHSCVRLPYTRARTHHVLVCAFSQVA